MPSYGLFDIIGPSMTGPSSSHTAGACRMGFIARRIANNDVVSAKFTLYGSFAETGKGHGTDRALVAGVLGMMPDDSRIPDAFDVAADENVAFEFKMSKERMHHPNTARIEITSSDGEATEVVGESVGGGNIKIVEINGLHVELTGDYPALILQYRDVPGVVSVVTHILAQHKINIAFMQVFRHGRGSDAYMTIETDEPVKEKTRALILGLSDDINRVFIV